MNSVNRMAGKPVKIITIIIAVLVGMAVPLKSAGTEFTQQWITRYNGTANGDDRAVDVAADGNGNVYVAGSTYVSGQGLNFLIIKYNDAGQEVWRHTYNGKANGDDVPSAMAVDSLGNVFVTGQSPGQQIVYIRGEPVVLSSGLDYLTVAYASDGTCKWTENQTEDCPGNGKDFNGLAFLADVATAIAVDDNYVYVAGNCNNSVVLGTDYCTLKYDKNDGSTAWNGPRVFNGWGWNNDEATAIAVDASRNVYVTGKSMSTLPGFYDYATVAYSENGNELWNSRYNRYDAAGVASDDQASAITVDGAGNVIVTGMSVATPDWGATSSDYVTIKYNSEGKQLWERYYNGTTLGYDIAQKVAVDAHGYIYVSGTSSPALTHPYIDISDYAALKYDPTGNEVWVARYNGSTAACTTRMDMLSDMALDSAGNVYLTGFSYELESWRLFWECSHGFLDYSTVEYNASGQGVFVARYNGPGNGDDNATAIAVDSKGNLYVTGVSPGAGTGLDIATIKYKPRDDDGDGYGENVDCNDHDASVYPGATEVCDGKDNDCNGQIDEGLPTLTYYRDADGDGYGTGAASMASCMQPAGYVLNWEDCNDANAAVHPGAVDVPGNGIDDNCDLCVDANMAYFYRDADGDLFGDLRNITVACAAPSGYVADHTDCDDTSSLCSPVGVENCDGKDNNCNGAIDENDVCDVTPPVITVPAPITAEATGPSGAVVAYTVTAYDDVSGAVIPVCAPPSGTTFALGATTVTCTAKDRRNNSAEASFIVTVVDTIPPVITASATPLPNGRGWNNTDVTVSYACADGGSGVNTAQSDLATDVLAASGSATGTCRDLAGNTATASVAARIDKTPPEIALASRTPANSYGWNNTGVVLVWSCTDAVSGAVAPSVSRTVEGEGADQSATAACLDLADNSASATETGINIDRTQPEITISGISNGATYVIGAVPAATYTAADLLSGIAGDSASLVCSNPSGIGICTYTVNAADKGGNTQVATASYQVVYNFSGYLAPVSLDKPFKLGSTVPVKFQLYNAGGSFISTAVANMTVQQFSGSEPAGDPIEATSTSSADSGNLFRYSFGDSQYIYNLSTRGLSMGTWQIRAVLDDGTVRTAFISLK